MRLTREERRRRASYRQVNPRTVDREAALRRVEAKKRAAPVIATREALIAAGLITPKENSHE